MGLSSAAVDVIDSTRSRSSYRDFCYKFSAFSSNDNGPAIERSARQFACRLLSVAMCSNVIGQLFRTFRFYEAQGPINGKEVVRHRVHLIVVSDQCPLELECSDNCTSCRGGDNETTKRQMYGSVRYGMLFLRSDLRKGISQITVCRRLGADV